MSRLSPWRTPSGLIADQLSVSRDSVIALVDIGATMTTLIVLRRQRSIYSREQVFGWQAAH